METRNYTLFVTGRIDDRSQQVDTLSIGPVTYDQAMTAARGLYTMHAAKYPTSVQVVWYEGGWSERERRYSIVTSAENGGTYEPFVNTIEVNRFENGRSWPIYVRLDTEYKVQKESTFTDSDYYQVCTIDAPQPTTLMREHACSASTKEECDRILIRIQEAQHRARHILAIKELEAIDADPEAIARVKARLFAYIQG